MQPNHQPDVNRDREAPLIDAAREEAQSLKAPSDAEVEPDAGRTATTPTRSTPAGGRLANGGAAPAGHIPHRIAHYDVIRVIESAGMGIVYEATQDHPRRTVAIKVPKHGITSGRALRRFEYESQVLAGMQHPAIAQVYDAGWHEEGGQRFPYFALEYIRNAKSIVEFANRQRLPMHDRLKLFITVCEAVHHAHQRGIIHRDLKPGNILVDPEGQIKIIDFGVARSVGANLDPRTYETSYGEMVGTLKYMSPEQCQADPHDLDTRSDIYALGVVLFELLTGHLPYDLDSAPYAEVPRIICEQPPTPLGSTDRALRGDIETIINKALEKDRRRRYQSALALAEDIQRFLDDEPIQARPPSAVYRLRKLVHRRRAPLAAASLVFVIGVVAAVAQAKAWVRGQRLHRLAVEVDLMQAGSELMELGREGVHEQDLLDTATRMLRLEPRHPGALALRSHVHLLYTNYDRALRDCTAALELDPTNHMALRTCAHVHHRQGDYDVARKMYEEGLGYYTVAFTKSLPMDLYNRARLRRFYGEYEKALEDYNRAAVLRPDFGLIFKGRGITRYMMGDIDEAVADLEHAASLPGRASRERTVECYLWIWEMRMLRNGPGDRAAAEEAFACAEQAAQADPQIKRLFDVLRDRTAAPAYLASLDDPGDRAAGWYYTGAQALIDRNAEKAAEHFMGAAEDFSKAKKASHQYEEYHLAKWHLLRLQPSAD